MMSHFAKLTGEDQLT